MVFEHVLLAVAGIWVLTLLWVRESRELEEYLAVFQEPDQASPD